ncbi:thioredoxin-dependent thiol peroxidase [Candidatus Protochlamydia sp. W-9]|uniref:thioredoxin-dependent thiol peroxidase n=1 Tax=Candidatus Protochlamydia sp. W-9 TaxID=1785087 RepID=UPI00096AC6D7|nr:thioredoxin-dependent thiol peroxidase [Candidatus Protochlamydia sp. W-9]
MNLRVSVQQQVPSFKALDEQNQLFSATNLLGQIYVLYFYPKDDTPGCTLQACQFRDIKTSFEKFETRIIGISPDSLKSHEKFSHKHQLNFTLLSDSSHEMCDLFGVWQEKKIFGKTKMGVIRSTFIVDAKGLIRWIESPAQVDGHAERVLKAIQILKNGEMI